MSNTNNLAKIIYNLASNVGSTLIGYLAPFVGAVSRTQANKNADTLDMRDFGLTVDGVTDQTNFIITKLTDLSSAGFRGWIKIPYNTKFIVPTVYAAVPTGIILDDESSINWAQPPSYKNKFRVMYSGDTVSDDVQFVQASGHHPAMMLLNMGTSRSTLGDYRGGSILHGVGIDDQKDPLLGWLFQFAKVSSSQKWRTMLRIETPYKVALGNCLPWTAGEVVAANAYRTSDHLRVYKTVAGGSCGSAPDGPTGTGTGISDGTVLWNYVQESMGGPTTWTTGEIVLPGMYRTSDSGKVYTTISGGTCGVTAPTGTGTGISDGGVLWNYVQAALGLDATRWDIDEDGNMAIYGPNASALEYTMQSGARSFNFGLNSTTNDVYWRDMSRGLDILRVTDATGIQHSIARSEKRLAVTGINPNAPVTGAGKVTNSPGTTMATLVKPTGVTNMIVTLRFDDGNTTINENNVTNGFRLKGGLTTGTIPVGSFITFELDTTDTSAWREVNRSF